MDEAAREVLRKLKPDIKKNLNLDEDILDTLEAGETLSSDLVEKIKAEKTNSEKISLLLFVLQRRGPDAFQAFIDAINPAYKFLADKLMDRYHEEVKKLDRDSGNSSEESLEPVENATAEMSTVAKEPVSPSSNNISCLPHVGNYTHSIIRNITNETTHVKLPSESHPTRRQSNHSLDFAIHPTNHFLHASRRSSHSIDFATHQSLNGMYTKLKMHLYHMNEREQSFSSPVPVTFDMVEDLLDKLLKLEQDCSRALGATNKDSLLTNIINLKLLKAELQKNMNKKEEQVQKYASKILKLETKCKNNEMTLNQQQKSMESLRLENQRLKEENEKLRDDLSKSEQSKQTEGETGPKDKSLRQMNRQNEELRKQVAKYEKELDIMSQKFTVLNKQKQTQDQTDHSSVMPNDNAIVAFQENGKRKEVIAKTLVSETNEPARSKPSTLQECRDLCAGASSRYNMQQMKNKILFAEATRTDNKNPSVNAEMAERGDDDLRNRRRQPYGTTNSYDVMTKLSANRYGVTQTSLMKQKSPVQVRKTMPYKGLKKNPRWGKKPLR